VVILNTYIVRQRQVMEHRRQEFLHHAGVIIDAVLDGRRDYSD